MSATRTNGKHGKHVSTVGTTQWTAGVHCTDPFPDRSILENKRPDLSDIALFVEVAKRRSFSRAAEALGMPNSLLSRRISRLERAVGVTLLHRSSRRVELTDLGRKYFEGCEKIVEDAEAAHEQLVRESSSPKGKIRMSVPVRPPVP